MGITALVVGFESGFEVFGIARVESFWGFFCFYYVDVIEFHGAHGRLSSSSRLRRDRSVLANQLPRDFSSQRSESELLMASLRLSAFVFVMTTTQRVFAAVFAFRCALSVVCLTGLPGRSLEPSAQGNV